MDETMHYPYPATPVTQSAHSSGASLRAPSNEEETKRERRSPKWFVFYTDIAGAQHSVEFAEKAEMNRFLATKGDDIEHIECIVRGQRYASRRTVRFEAVADEPQEANDTFEAAE